MSDLSILILRAFITTDIFSHLPEDISVEVSKKKKKYSIYLKQSNIHIPNLLLKKCIIFKLYQSDITPFLNCSNFEIKSISNFSF